MGVDALIWRIVLDPHKKSKNDAHITQDLKITI